jgi:cell division transport system ATP-binding protein
MIVFDKVSKKYPLGNIALNEASFEIEDNDFVYLVGQSGAGKTTILKLILREYAPTSGTVLVGDEDIGNPSFRDIQKLRRNIGVVFQDFKVLEDKNIFENVALSLRVLESDEDTVKIAVKKALELVGLAEKDEVFPMQLSAGELQRVAIARAIVGDRKIILADEPTGNLDPKTAWDIMKIFRKLEGKKMIIIATHNTDIVNSYRKRVIILKGGKIVKDKRGGGYDI